MKPLVSNWCRSMLMLPGNAVGSVRPAGGPSRPWRTTAASATGRLLLLLGQLLACPESWLGSPARPPLGCHEPDVEILSASGCRCILRMDHHCPWVSHSNVPGSLLRACMEVSHMTPFRCSACMGVPPHIMPCTADELLHRLPQLPLLHSVYVLRLPGIGLCSEWTSSQHLAAWPMVLCARLAWNVCTAILHPGPLVAFNPV